ncbi:MAG: CARDB domain-containing protein [Myxococcota bacterium]|jgi:subtilase family serine protease|nr:CARDB domain-containing protein [Myxococcota bacterium]
MTCLQPRYASFRGILRLASSLLLMALLTACGDESTPPEDVLPDVEGGLVLFSLDASVDKGYVPLQVTLSVQLRTDDPRAELDVHVDFGDGTQQTLISRTSLGEPDPEAPELETTPENRSLEVEHLFESAGEYTIEVYAIDKSNSTEENEIRSNTQSYEVIVEALPDLIAVGVDCDKNQIDLEESFDVSLQVLNNGTPVQNPFDVEVYLVSRPDLLPEELVDSNVAIKLTVVRASNGLGAAESLNESVTTLVCDPRRQECERIFSQVSKGTWYPAIYVDPPNATRPELNVLEQDESNNFRVASAGLSIKPAAELPDLRPARITGNPRTTDILRQVIVSFDVLNEGGADAASSTYRIFLSEGDRTLDPEDLQIAEGNTNAILQGGKHVIANLSFNLPTAIVNPTQLYVLVRVDIHGQVEESNETNNIASAELPITVTGAKLNDVDLTVRNLGVSPTTTYIGGRLDMSFEVVNLGADDPGTYQCTIFISRDDELVTSSDTLLLQVGGEDIPGNGTKLFERQIFVPTFLTPGPHYLFVFCDPQGRIQETDEDNNIAGPSAEITINAVPQVDFVVRNLDVKPVSIPEHDTLYFYADVCNDGSDIATPAGIVALLSGDDTVELEDTVVASSSIPESLAPGECAAVELNGKVSCLPFDNNYIAGLYVDWRDDFIETDEDNNLAAFNAPIEIVGGPGSYCSCLDDDLEPNNERDEAIEVTLLGTSPKTAEYLDRALCDEADYYVVQLNRGDIITARIDFDPALGDIDLRMYDDNESASPFVSASTTAAFERLTRKYQKIGANFAFIEVYSKNGGHNYYSLSISVDPSPTEPDLSIPAINLLSGNFPSLTEPYLFNVKILNNGLSAAENFHVKTWLSRNTLLDVNDVEIAELPVASLDAYSELDVEFSYTFPESIVSANYYIIARVDSQQLITEVLENNNDKVSTAFTVDADCVIDSYEGVDGNDTFATAYPILPAQAMQSWDGLNVCTSGRHDFFLVCVPAETPLNHVGIINQDLSSSSTMEVKLYDRGTNLLDTGTGATLAVISTQVPSAECTTTCPDGESCVNGFCQDSEGMHCVYAQVILKNAPTSSRPYELIVDTGVPLQTGEPINDTSTNALIFSPALNSLAAGDGHAAPENDTDWFYADVKGGVSFTALFRSYDQESRLTVYYSGAPSGIAVRPFESRNISISSNQRVTLKVNKTAASTDPTTTYSIELGGLEGIDLVPKSFSGDVNLVARNGAVLVSWMLANERMTDTAGPVSYRYYVSDDAVLDGSDTLVIEKTTAGPDGFSELSIQEKVYMTVPIERFGDFRLLVQVDGIDAYVEENEENNVASFPLTILQDCLADSEEPNNDFGNATLLAAAPQWLSDLSACANDVDVFRVTVPAETTYNISIDNMTIWSRGDLDLFIYDASFNLLGASDQLNTASEALSHINSSLSPEDIYIVVMPFRTHFTNVYELTISE